MNNQHPPQFGRYGQAPPPPQLWSTYHGQPPPPGTAAWGAPPMPPAQQHLVFHVMPAKSMVVAYILLIFLGGFGAHDFYLRRPGSGATKIALNFIGWCFYIPGQIIAITSGELNILLMGGNVLHFGLGVWLFVELFTTYTRVNRLNDLHRQHVMRHGYWHG